MGTPVLTPFAGSRRIPNSAAEKVSMKAEYEHQCSCSRHQRVASFWSLLAADRSHVHHAVSLLPSFPFQLPYLCYYLGFRHADTYVARPSLLINYQGHQAKT